MIGCTQGYELTKKMDALLVSATCLLDRGASNVLSGTRCAHEKEKSRTITNYTVYNTIFLCQTFSLTLAMAKTE